jgi:hypothetical protein
MDCAFQASSDSHCELKQFTGLLVYGTAVMDEGPEPIISLPNFRVSFFEILVSLWQLSHKNTSSLINDVFIIVMFYSRGQLSVGFSDSKVRVSVLQRQ